jgi:hypothetical protein
LLSALEPLDAQILIEIEAYAKACPDRSAEAYRMMRDIVGLIEKEQVPRPKADLHQKSLDAYVRRNWPNLASLITKFGSPDAVTLSLENLARLALVYDSPVVDLRRLEIPTEPTIVSITDDAATIDLTNTGRALLNVCRR